MSELPKLVYQDSDRGWQLPSRPSDVECRIETLRDEVAELRAILAPLLWDPIRWEGMPDANVCVFCGSEAKYRKPEHAPDCPVLRKDALLGR